jgi:aromatase
MHTSNTLTIRGDLEQIYSYAARVERWPEILPHYRDVRILEPGDTERLVSMQCVRAFGWLKWPCKWTARQRLVPDEFRILFSHVSGPARGMRVEWRLLQLGEGVQATIRHAVNSSRLPWSRLYWEGIVGPLFIRSIADQTLAAIKRLAEGEVKS